MATVETILEKIENIKDSKSRIINTLLKKGAEVSQDALLKEIPDVIEEQSIGGTALNEHINTLATTNQYGHVRLATSLNDNDTGVVPSIDLLNGDFSSKFVTNDNILGGISTQTILGYDGVSETTTNNNIYLGDDHLVVHSLGNEISFPNKAGTVALTSDITDPPQATKSEYGTVKISSTLSETTDNIVPSISQVFRDSREVAQNASDGDANVYGWVGTLRDLNVSFERVGISTLSLKKRSGSAPNNTAYARIVHVGSSGTVEVLFQSKNSISWGNVSASSTVTYEMVHIKGRAYPTNTERIAIYFVSNKTNADNVTNIEIGVRTESGKRGAIIASQSSTTSLPAGQGGYRPVIGLAYYNATENLESRLIESIDETKLDKSHEDKIATHLEYGHIKLGTQYTIDTADDNFGVIGKTSNGQLAYRMDSVPTSGSRLPVKSGGVYQALSSYVPLSGGTVNGTLTIDTSDVVDKAPLVLKVHTQQSDPSRPLIVVRDETGSEFVTMKVKRAEEAASYEGQLLLECEAFTVFKLSTQTGVMGPAGVAPTTGTWSDAGGAWKLDLKKGELAITDNGWETDENITPQATTFLRFTDILKSSDVPSWAKQETKPTYTASEVGAQPAGKYVTYDTTSHQLDAVSKETSFAGGIRTDSFKTLYGTPFFNTESNYGFNITGFYRLNGYLKEDKPLLEWDIGNRKSFLDVTEIYENGTLLSNKYETKSNVSSALSGKQDKLTAGDNISIKNGTISVTNIDTTPTAGSNNLVSSGGVKSYIDSIVGDIKSRLEAL